MDKARGVIYGDTFPGRKMFRYDIESGEVRELDDAGRRVHRAPGAGCGRGRVAHVRVDAVGGTVPAFCATIPDRDEIDFTNVDLPDVMPEKKGSNQIDTALLTRDGALYIGTAAGALAQVDHRGPEVSVTYLGQALRCAPHEGAD